MKDERRPLDQLTAPRLLFAGTVLFLLAALAVGFAVNRIPDDPRRLRAAGICGLFLAAMIFALAVGYLYRCARVLKTVSARPGGIRGAYRSDRTFRVSVNNAVTALFDLSNAFVQFVASFRHNRYYLLSVAAVGFLVFTMKLFLLTGDRTKSRRQSVPVSALLGLMGVAATGVIWELVSGNAGVAPKGLLIYWDALYAFLVFGLAVHGLRRAAKEHDRTVGLFLAVKLSNAAFGMFSLTVSLLTTFGGDFDARVWYISVGAGAVALIFGIAAVLLVTALRKKPDSTAKTDPISH